MGITQQIGASSLIKPGVIDNTAARPASPYEGQVIFQKDTDQLLVWNGTEWVIPNSPAQNPQGLELIKTQTIGSAVSSVEVTSAFSATYDNYLIQVNNAQASNQTDLTLKLGSTVTGYYGNIIYGAYSSTAVNAINQNNAASFGYVTSTNSAAGNRVAAQINLFSPFLSINTQIEAPYLPAGYNNAYGSFRGVLDNSTSYTSFTLAPNGGTLTGGTITVYGYRKA